MSGEGTIAKACAVLDQVAAFQRPVRYSELLENSPFPKATLYRILQSLSNQGMLTYNKDAQTYSMGVRLVRLAHSAWTQASLAPIARPHIDKLAEKVHETIHLAQLDNGQVLFVDKRQSNGSFDTLARAGRVAPSYCTGVGKAMLAFMSEDRRERALKQQSFMAYTPSTHILAATLNKELKQVQSEGVAFDREEHEQGIISIAAPILAANDTVIGAISIATSTSRRSLDDLEQLKPVLKQTAAQISTEASNWQFPS
ncbi:MULTISPECIES: IclR family transcriptional regulator [Halocynthiibacter]|uniref:IclR family transcriptional regulator n=1 Tax=Halocynthiibacter halioticoli TaxID=2986804 RepID=A0AAE3IZT1_9RHOB|nr:MULTISPECIES: IclR family transcriptional regulator [Halocynthiibacter]MCV6823516.1 IclR family transcriptional regulator [Halocynthiibacter halioticoli]MCW4056517.1 IclR family transcriptional regulator [Halocynthiibacter sp. SDUM655004]